LLKAIVMNAYGGPEVLELKDVDKPQVSENDVLIGAQAAALNAGDYFSMRGSPWLARFNVGFPKPKDYILGWDVAGQVEAVGTNVTQFQPGDKVFAACSGTLAEYVSAPEGTTAMAPANLTLEQAAAVPAAASAALHALRDQANVQPGQKVLINGASGGVGTYCVQIAKALGAEVTGVCSTRNVEMVRSLGADHVIDYTREDFSQGGPRYDLIVDNVGNHSFAACRGALAPGGTHLPNTGHGGMSYVFKAYILSALMKQHASPFLSVPNAKDLDYLKDLVEAEKLRPVIDRTYPLSEAREAFRYLEEEHAQGKVVITM
jgi:NADPH:quinone reductase-like Zn-dependent oxidoreductase